MSDASPELTVLAPDDIPEPTQGHSTRHRLNGLDGYRGMALVIVVLYHFNVPVFPGGWIAPTLFFVLSGYLITTLLIDRVNRVTRTKLLGDFWVRRIRRLYPGILFLVSALIAIIAVMTSLRDTTAMSVPPSALTSELWSLVGYYANWHLIAAHIGYFGQSPTLLKHTWSLAIEEQFYLVFPLIFVLIAASRTHWRSIGLVVSIVGAAASIAITFVETTSANVNIIYYSTQTNAYHLLIGTAFAFAFHGWQPSERATKRLTLVALPALVTIVAFLQIASTPSGAPELWVFKGGGTFLDLTAAALLMSLVYGRTTAIVSRAFNLRPLVWIGTVSYGLYLWHYPVFILTTRSNTHAGRWGLVVIQIVLTIVMTVFSYRCVELVVRETEIRSLRVRWTIYAAGLAATGALLLAAPRLLTSLS